MSTSIIILDLENGEPLDEEAIKKKMEEINEMFDVSGEKICTQLLILSTTKGTFYAPYFLK